MFRNDHHGPRGRRLARRRDTSPCQRVRCWACARAAPDPTETDAHADSTSYQLHTAGRLPNRKRVFVSVTITPRCQEHAVP